MRLRLFVFICSCLLVLGLIGCSTPEETTTTLSPPKAQAEVKKSPEKKEVLPLDNASAVVPVRDPFAPLIVAFASSEGQINKGSGTQNSGDTDTEFTGSQQSSIELIAVYQQGNSAYASLKDDKQLADVTVGETFCGYEVMKIDLQNNQVRLAKGGERKVLKNNQSTK